jgi:mono/diheme cytochrome c family protein
MYSLKMLFRIALVVAASCARAAEPAAPASAELVALGKYRVTTSGCHDCHTPMKMTPQGPQPDMDRALSGHPESLDMPAAPVIAQPWGMIAAGTNTAFAGPWGVSFTANLTPDRETGLGKWTLRNFTETIRTGRHLGRGREILPPMPIPMYKHFNDQDLAAIFAYLQSIPAVKNRVPAPRAPAPAAMAAVQKPL